MLLAMDDGSSGFGDYIPVLDTETGLITNELLSVATHNAKNMTYDFMLLGKFIAISYTFVCRERYFAYCYESAQLHWRGYTFGNVDNLSRFYINNDELYLHNSVLFCSIRDGKFCCGSEVISGISESLNDFIRRCCMVV